MKLATITSKETGKQQIYTSNKEILTVYTAEIDGNRQEIASIYILFLQNKNIYKIVYSDPFNIKHESFLKA